MILRKRFFFTNAIIIINLYILRQIFYYMKWSTLWYDIFGLFAALQAFFGFVLWALTINFDIGLVLTRIDFIYIILL